MPQDFCSMTLGSWTTVRAVYLGNLPALGAGGSSVTPRDRRSYSFDIFCKMRKPNAAFQEQSGQCGPRKGKLDLTPQMKMKDADLHRPHYFALCCGGHRGRAPRDVWLDTYTEGLVERFPCLLLPSEVQLNKRERHLL